MAHDDPSGGQDPNAVQASEAAGRRGRRQQLAAVVERREAVQHLDGRAALGNVDGLACETAVAFVQRRRHHQEAQNAQNRSVKRTHCWSTQLDEKPLKNTQFLVLSSTK